MLNRKEQDEIRKIIKQARRDRDYFSIWSGTDEDTTVAYISGKIYAYNRILTEFGKKEKDES